MTELELPKNQLLRAHQRDDHAGEIEGMKSMIPSLKTPQDRSAVQQRIKRMEANMAAQSPDPNVSGSVKDQITREIHAIEERVLPGMLSQEEMRKNPPGAVGQHMRWEKTYKKDILNWKNLQLMREPESDDPDLANFERLRPTGAMDRVRLDAQIPGKMSYTNIPQAQWDQSFPDAKPINSALEQTKRRGKQVDTQFKQEQEARTKAYLERMKTSHGMPIEGLPKADGQEGS